MENNSSPPTKPTSERTGHSVWNQPFTFMAYIEGFKVQARLNTGNCISIYLDFKTAWVLDVPPTVTVADTPKKALEWVRIHVPAGWDKDWLIAYFTRLDPEAYRCYCHKIYMERAAASDQVHADNLAWANSEEFRRIQFKRLMLELAQPDVA